MALSDCRVETDSQGRELFPLGRALFPLACFDEDLLAHPVPWHWHDDFEAILVTRGRAEVCAENMWVSIGPGDGVLINSGVLHSAEGGAAGEALCHSLVFHPRLIGGSVDSVFWQRLVDPVVKDKALLYQFLDHTVPWQAEIIAGLTRVWQAAEAEGEDWENEARYLLSKAFRTWSLNRAAPQAGATEQEQRAAERTKTMMGYIHDHYAGDLTLESIARSAAVSKSVCLRSFRQVIGTTPMRYLLQYRLGRAADGLRTTDRQVSDIAAACGFTDVSYFTKRFREWQGLSPTEYRKSLPGSPE